MGLTVCGWCAAQIPPGPECPACGHEDPARPWAQRGQEPPEVAVAPGRHPLDGSELRRRLSSGGGDAQIAERFEVDERTVRRWRARVSG